MRTSLRAFVPEAWHVVEPSMDYIEGWHMDAVCEHLQAVSAGDITRLLINIPPGHSKSLLASVLWQGWDWLENPQTRWLCASYGMSLALRDSQRARELLESDWYQETFRPLWYLADDQNSKSHYRNSTKGERLSISVGGKTTGFRGHRILIDDPLNAMDAYSTTKRENAIMWLDQAASNRLNNQKTGTIVMIMQRLHEQDPAGHVLKQGGYTHLSLPSKYESRNKCRVFINETLFWEDPRQKEGELLFEGLFPKDVIAQEEKRLGPYAFAGQHQQRPAPADGGVFKERWWRYWCPGGFAGKLQPVTLQNSEAAGGWETIPTLELPAIEQWVSFFDGFIQSWDMAFKGTETSAFVVGQIWARKGANFFLLDQVRAQLDIVGTIDAVLKLSAKWQPALAKLIEDKANGPAVMDMLRGKLPGMIPIQPEGDKLARAHAVVPLIHGGNVFLPHPDLHECTMSLKAEARLFPNGQYKDQIDTMTQALRFYEQGANWGTSELEM